MIIQIAKHSGFCYGVKRAIQILDDLIEANKGEKRIFTLGPIIHNNQVTEYYEEKGIKAIEKLANFMDNRMDGDRLVIRSHGAPKSVYDLAEAQGFEIHDATCPYVKKIQNTVSSYYLKGYNIIIVGDQNHPEVLGINGWCDESATIVNTLHDVEDMHPSDELFCIVAQTTFKLSLWEQMSTLFSEKLSNAVIQNTICLATEQRQKACIELSKTVEFMIVIGGKHSSNTRKLAEICSRNATTIHIETKDDLVDVSMFKSNTKIGIAAGASTPDWIVESVILKIENEGEVFFDGKS
ncbi:4-hydroxy-3-methylbut-2-enyl diphosphate reductase [Fusibacter sp. 3D3]|uniref:4-hydroxy-3-methylbut-2-enyl diphosphate reductase n=1 Tax=Fusibacter sp. 3D3 TaxID=1048380 RepID=UPI000852A2FE|nr:4-hydroxy-3-methylbut-2-enyl diphosphate reductase [Fusibacter sp. 3D3]GAU76993.1 4-hydroxy-3-methylbut-2-enyl diphosphate reductase [Fusibacter sp. 3D3]